MKHLHFENIGPITIVDIDLKRYNIFIGPQSSGKSTIAKMISFCTWIEKRALTTLSENVFLNKQEFIENVEEYHKMHDYFNEKSVLEYNSQNIHILYKDSKLSIKILDKTSYKRKKILYIPSDRNLVAMPRLDRLVLETNTNLRSFIFDWFDARGAYDKSHRLSILDLNMEYYYDKDAKKVSQDRIIHTNGKTYDIALSDASSGLQSITPLTLLLSYYTNQYFIDYGKTTSYKKDEEKKELEEKIGILYPVIVEDAQNAKGLYNAIERRSLFNKLTTPHSTDFIIEEPEQNLFPEAQESLLYWTIERIKDPERANSIVITTHSPYILFALNNCLIGGLVGDKLESQALQSRKSWLRPSDVAVYEIHDGALKSIQDEDGLLNNNYLNLAYKKISAEYMTMLAQL
ncbi:MAG: ATP-binding protein [Paludibacteraceae bacterium]|nr:ATP-binding protein [Paludibacteraceae bacterium]